MHGYVQMCTIYTVYILYTNIDVLCIYRQQDILEDWVIKKKNSKVTNDMKMKG